MKVFQTFHGHLANVFRSDFAVTVRFDHMSNPVNNLVNTLEVRDIVMEEEPIEDIVKRIYLSGEVV